jgi:hypothetical protein
MTKLKEGCINGCDAPTEKDGLCEECLNKTERGFQSVQAVIVKLHIPPDLHKEVKSIAKEQWRTLEGQILSWIEADVAEWRQNKAQISRGK